MPDTRYQKQPTESIDQYNERVKQYYTPTTSTGVGSTTLSQDQTKAANQGKPGYDVLGNPIPGATVPRTIDESVSSTNGDPVDTFLNTWTKPESREEIAERKRKSAQSVIDSINKNYDDQVAEKRMKGEERLRINNATSVMSGLTGSTEAGASRGKVLDANDKEIAAVNNVRALEINKLYRDINTEAETEAREQLADATRSAESIVTRRKEAQTKTIDNLKLMASAGLVDYDAFSTKPQNKKVYDHAVQAAGSDEALRAIFMLNRPKDQIVGTPIRIGNKYVQQYQNPLTGKVTFEQMALPFDLPTEYNKFQQMGDNLVAIPDGWDGDVTKLKTVGSTLGSTDRLQQDLLRKQIGAMDAPAARQTQVVETEDGRKILIDSQTGEEIKNIGAGATPGATSIAPNSLADLLLQYRTAVEGSSKLGRALSPSTRGEIASLRGQITATYKQEKKLGTLDAGVQKLIEGIIGSDTTGASVINPYSKANNSAVIAGVDSFLKNEGKIDLSNVETLRAELQSNEIMVVDRATGQIGALPQDEYDPSKYIEI